MLKKFLLLLIPLALMSCAKRYSGSITGKKIWKGRIKLTGDVVVERRSRLTIMPGTVISYAKKPDRQVRYIREESAGSFNILQNDRIEILVAGSLNALGTKEKPVTLQKSETAGGLVFLGKEPSKLSHVLIDGAPAAIRLYGENRAEISNCLIQNSDVAGIGIWDLSNPKITGTTFKNCRHAIGTSDFAAPEISSCSILFSKMAGIFCEGNSSPLIRNCLISGNNVGIAGGDISRPEIRANKITGNGAGISLWVKTSAKISDNNIKGNVTGILVQDEAKAMISSNVFDSNGSAVSSVNAGNPVIEKNFFRRNDFAVILRDSSRAKISENEISSGRGIKISEVSSAKIEHNSFKDCSEAVKLMNRSTAVIRNNKMSGVKTKIIDERVKASGKKSAAEK